MPSLIDPRKRKVPILPYLAANTDSTEDRCIACFLKFIRHGIVDSRRDFLAAYPVAREVSVAIHQCYFDAAVEEIADIVEAVWAEEIASACECFGNCNVLCAVVDGYT